MKLDSKSEDPNELVPHVMVAAAAYGDPTGKYMAYVKKIMPEYDTRVYQFYNQIGAFTSSPASGSKAKPAARKRDFYDLADGNIVQDTGAGEEETPRPVSDWHSMRDFNKLEPPLALSKRVVSQDSKPPIHVLERQVNDTIASQWSDLLQMRGELVTA